MVLLVEEMDMATWVQILDEAVYISHSVNTFNAIILPPTTGK